MATIALMIKLEEQHLADVLQEAGAKLDTAGGEVVLDFSCVRRVRPADVKALAEFSRLAETKAVKLVLRGVNVDIYKVLKLVRLASKLSFVA